MVPYGGQRQKVMEKLGRFQWVQQTRQMLVEQAPAAQLPENHKGSANWAKCDHVNILMFQGHFQVKGKKKKKKRKLHFEKMWCRAASEQSASSSSGVYPSILFSLNCIYTYKHDCFVPCCIFILKFSNIVPVLYIPIYSISV